MSLVELVWIIGPWLLGALLVGRAMLLRSTVTGARMRHQLAESFADAPQSPSELLTQIPALQPFLAQFPPHGDDERLAELAAFLLRRAKKWRWGCIVFFTIGTILTLILLFQAELIPVAIFVGLGFVILGCWCAIATASLLELHDLVEQARPT